AAIAPQVQNGHVLDQTVWSYHFEPGTDKLTPGGMEQLITLGRRRPVPDPTIFIQTAQVGVDLVYDPTAPSKLAERRLQLDNDRVAAVQKFLNAQTDGRHLAFQVLVHDPASAG